MIAVVEMLGLVTVITREQLHPHATLATNNEYLVLTTRQNRIHITTRMQRHFLLPTGRKVLNQRNQNRRVNQGVRYARRPIMCISLT